VADSFLDEGTATTLPTCPKFYIYIAKKQASEPQIPVKAVTLHAETEDTDAGVVDKAIGLMKEEGRESCWDCYRIFSGGRLRGQAVLLCELRGVI
jgi:hypothetical protein